MKSVESYHPIFTTKPEPGYSAEHLTFERFLELLTEEEDYYDGEQHNTKLMITRLRKIYYDSWGWSTQVIRKAAKIPGRYQTEMVPGESQTTNSKSSYRHNNKYEIVLLTYKVTYRKDDKIYPERAGQTPEIYANNNQELVTPQGIYCDIGHVLSGIDAYNNFAPVSPLPNFLLFLRFLFPSVDSNMDFATWLGDIASASGDFLFEVLRRKTINSNEQQQIIDNDDPPADIIGNVDSYAIKEIFDTKTSNGLRVTEILRSYFYDKDLITKYQSKAISTFCSGVGLKGWDGNNFSNEKEWIKYYKSQLRNATAFYVFGEVGKLKGFWLALKIWFRFFEKTLNLDLLLQIFLNGLKKQIIHEHKK